MGDATERSSDDASGLDLARWGLRFSRRETETSYREWHMRKAVPFTRIGMAAAVFGWLLGLLVIRLGGMAGLAQVAKPILLVMLPAILGSIAISYRPRLIRWMLPSVVVANLFAGLLMVYVARVVQMPEISMAMVTVNTYFAFGIFRLLPAQAILAVAPYIALNQWVVATAFGGGRLGAPQLVAYTAVPLIAFVSGLLVCVVIDRISRESFRQERIIEAQRREIERERSRADELLFSILPRPIAERLKRAPEVIADRFDEVTVLFADVVGFTPLAARLGPERLVAVLNELFTRFDALAVRHGVEKIKTIGDAYMAVAGLPSPCEDHARAVAELALEMRVAVSELSAKNGYAMEVRIGMCSGPVVAGVIGARKFAYDLWGDTVNTAARMESHGVAGEIQVAEPTWERLRERYPLRERGVVEVKGKGPMRTWLLDGPARVSPTAR